MSKSGHVDESVASLIPTQDRIFLTSLFRKDQVIIIQLVGLTVRNYLRF